jgi:hypothetical protein
VTSRILDRYIQCLHGVREGSRLTYWMGKVEKNNVSGINTPLDRDQSFLGSPPSSPTKAFTDFNSIGIDGAVGSRKNINDRRRQVAGMSWIRLDRIRAIVSTMRSKRALCIGSLGCADIHLSSLANDIDFAIDIEVGNAELLLVVALHLNNVGKI